MSNKCQKTKTEVRLSSRAAHGLLFVVLFGLVAVPLNAQVAGARIAGTVMDSTGAVIVGAQVTIKNTADGFTQGVGHQPIRFLQHAEFVARPLQRYGVSEGFQIGGPHRPHTHGWRRHRNKFHDDYR